MRLSEVSPGWVMEFIHPQKGATAAKGAKRRRKKTSQQTERGKSKLSAIEVNH